MLPESMMLDYDVLRFIWWGLLGVLLIGFAVMDGFDMGVACLMPFIAPTDMQKRVLLNSIGPVWEGNQVWLILGAGAIFAAWPTVYAAAFSGFYIAMFLVLVALILRPVGFDYRNKVAHPLWRSIWDLGLFIGGFVPPLIFGIAVGNLMQGVPFTFDQSLHFYYQGGFIDLLNPFAIFCGVVSVLMMIQQGASFLMLKTVSSLYEKAKQVIGAASLLLVVLFTTGGIWVALGIDGYKITSEINTSGMSNPLNKTVTVEPGVWFDNFKSYFWLAIVPLVTFISLILTLIFSRKNRAGWTFIASSLSLAGIIGTVGVSMFPFLMPSNTDPNVGLTVWDASSSRNTLQTMLIAVLIFMPLVLFYTSWVFRVLRGKVTEKDIEEKSGELY